MPSKKFMLFLGRVGFWILALCGIAMALLWIAFLVALVVIGAF